MATVVAHKNEAPAEARVKAAWDIESGDREENSWAGLEGHGERQGAGDSGGCTWTQA
jgi:hypothetical protein